MSLFRCVLLVMVLSLGTTAAASLNQGVAEITLEEHFSGATFDSAMPTQVAVTGVKPGERPLRPDEVVRFLETLAVAWMAYGIDGDELSGTDAAIAPPVRIRTTCPTARLALGPGLGTRWSAPW